MTAVDALRIASSVAWGAGGAVLLPAMWRLARRRSRYLDAFWGVCLLGVFNRICFSARLPQVLDYSVALVVALMFAGFAYWYQKHDKKRG